LYSKPRLPKHASLPGKTFRKWVALIDFKIADIRREVFAIWRSQMIRNFHSIQTLKKQAKVYAKEKQVSLHQAQALIANEAGFSHWSVLINNYSTYSLNDIREIFSMLKPGHVMLVSADKNVGKMSFAMNLISEASRNKISSTYFLFYEQVESVLSRIKLIFAKDKNEIDARLIKINYLDSDYKAVIRDLENQSAGSFIVIDYLQKLPLKNLNPFILKLSKLAKNKGLRIVALSQKLAEMPDSHKLYRHFNHVLILDYSQGKDNERCCSLIKSTHYQIQKNKLVFNRSCYKFESLQIKKSLSIEQPNQSGSSI
jgi:hypothetical protein